MSLEDLKNQIYQLRNVCDSKRQSSHNVKLQELSSILTLCGKLNPYDLNEKRDEFIEKTKIFSEGAKGVIATVKDGIYLYRIQSVGGFLRSVMWRDTSVSSADTVEIWNKLRNKSRKSDDGWLNLKKYARGTYPASLIDDPEELKWWNFAWWTTYNLESNVVLGATKIGMCSDWVTSRTIVFRSPVSIIQTKRIAHVPTVIDAFMQPIFYPVQETPPPSAGITIDLSNDDLCEGVDEYIIKPIDSESIEILPLNVSEDLVKQFGAGREEDTRILTALISYYQCL